MYIAFQSPIKYLSDYAIPEKYFITLSHKQVTLAEIYFLDVRVM